MSFIFALNTAIFVVYLSPFEVFCLKPLEDVSYWFPILSCYNLMTL